MSWSQLYTLRCELATPRVEGVEDWPSASGLRLSSSPTVIPIVDMASKLRRAYDETLDRDPLASPIPRKTGAQHIKVGAKTLTSCAWRCRSAGYTSTPNSSPRELTPSLR